MAGVGRRLYEVLRANLNALLDRASERERRMDEPREDPLEEDDASRPPGWRRDLAQHYANLELPYGAGLAAVKKQYRKLMSRYHPDRHVKDAEKAEIANRLAAELTRSYDVIVAHLEGRDEKG